MAISIEHLSNTKKECIVTYSSQEFKEKYKKKFKAFKPKARIDGFRPGKISDSVIEKKFGLSLKQEVIDEMLQSAWTNIIEEHKVEPIAHPVVDIIPTNNLSELTLDTDLTIKYVFEVNPSFDVVPFEQLNLNFVNTELDEKQVASYERHLARTMGEQKPSSEPAQLHNIVIFDADFNVNGVLSKENNVTMFLDAEESNEDFVKNIVGLNVGDEKSFSYEGVPNALNKMKTGDRVDATVKVVEIKEVILADRAKIKDAYNQSRGAAAGTEYSDENFEQDLKKAAKLSVEERDFAENKNLLLKAIEDAYSFEVPELYLEQTVNADAEKKEKSIKQVRRDLALQKYYEMVKPVVTEQDVQRAILKYMLEQEIPFEYLQQALNNNKGFRELFHRELLLEDFVKKVIKSMTDGVSLEVVAQKAEKSAKKSSSKAKKHEHHEG